MHNFTHLQVHSHYTLLGGTASLSELADRAASDGMSHLALTDTNALYGAVAFDKACRAAGVQPILGMTVTVTAPQEAVIRDEQGAGSLVLLATGPEGYSSLCRLSSLIQGCPDRESHAARGLDWEALKAHRMGLLCLGGGRKGWVQRYIRARDLNAAHRYAGRLAGIYGDGAYLGLELHGPDDTEIGHEVVMLGLRLGLPVVAIQPVYCLWPQDAPRLRLLAAIDHNCRQEDVPASALPDGGDPKVDVYWLSPDEVAVRFAEFPQAVAAVGDVAMRCEPALPDGRPLWPALNLPKGKPEDGVLAELARAGFEGRYGTDPDPELHERLEKELTLIARHGYAPLFLVVADIMRFAREARVPYGTRGSVANSLVAYCAGITTIDPIAHDLLFERFLSPDRADPPDIDLNFCSRRRDKVLDYIRETYGADRVALVSTISTMRPRSAVRETAKAFGLDEADTKQLMAVLPAGWLSRRRWDADVSLDDAVARLQNPRWRQIVRAASGLMGQPHHLSLHPGGVVITPGPQTDILPVQWTPKGFLATQFDHHDLTALGLTKIDLLGVRALTVLDSAAALVQKHYDPDFRAEDIPVPAAGSEQPDDAYTGDMLARAETIGVFQCESAGARRTQRQLKTRTVYDLAVANAFFKPAPAMGGMARTFVRRYRGEEPVTNLHPALEPILGRTKGVLLFQEQVLRVAREVGGLSWAEAHALRYGRLHPDELARVHQRFLEGCQNPSTGSGRGPATDAAGPPAPGTESRDPEGGERGQQVPGLTAQQAATLWEQVTSFAGFSLNQGHATAYADLSYRSAYVKARWPAAFLCARLADWGGFHHPAIYIAEAVRLGISVRPPHVNHSGNRFTLEVSGDGDASVATLWMGLGQVRDLRRASVQHILAERERASFADLRDLLRRVPLQPKEVRHLIQCGGLDGLGESRAAALAEAEEIRLAGSAAQLAFSFAQPQVAPEAPALRLAWERHVLGQPVSVHPLELVADRLPQHSPLRQLPDRPVRGVTVGGVRLPGWTGGRGFFLGDEDTFVTVQGSDPAPPTWQPILVHGDWVDDEWGTFWLKADKIERVGEKSARAQTRQRL